jgi:hypothetical protein
VQRSSSPVRFAGHVRLKSSMNMSAFGPSLERFVWINHTLLYFALGLHVRNRNAQIGTVGPAVRGRRCNLRISAVNFTRLRLRTGWPRVRVDQNTSAQTIVKLQECTTFL